VQSVVLHVRAVQLVTSHSMFHIMNFFYPLVRVKGEVVNLFLQQNLAL